MRRGVIPGALASLSCLLLAPPPAAADWIETCRAAPGCTVAREVAVGADGDGNPLTLAELVHEQAPPESWAAGFPCRDGWRAFWLTVADQPPQKRLELCNDGYGAAGVGEDDVSFGNNWMTHAQSGGSAWRWTAETVYRLQPFAVLQESTYGGWTLGANYEQSRWDWSDWSEGYAEWWAPFCEADGLPPDSGGQTPADATPYRYVPIPALAEGLLPAGTIGAELGTCAATLNTDRKGFLVYDRAGDAADEYAWMKLLLAEPDTLLVTLRLDAVLSGGKSWLSDDHLEIWQGSRTTYFDHCLDPMAEARQWAVRLSDGAVFAAHGESKLAPQVLALNSRPSGDGGIVVSLAIELIERDGNLTVVLSRGDGAKRQRWLLASSALAFGKAETLGRSYRIGEPAAGCALVDGKLERISFDLPASVE